MMNRKSPNDIPIRIICALLFALFSFLYIFLFQGEQLALVQDHLSGGLTTNNTLVTALLVTLLLMGVQWLLNRVGKLHGKYEAFSYTLSGVLLALITKIDDTFSYSLEQWVAGLLIATVIYLLVVWVDRNVLHRKDVKFFNTLSVNLGVMTALFVFVGWYGNNSPARQMELYAWRYTHSGDYAKVLEVGKRSDDCNIRLVALRNLALAKTGKLGSELFAYPQPYGSDGLMMSLYNVQTSEYGSEKFYNVLGSRPYGGENATAFYKRMMLKSDTAYYRDLYATALLLDKKLEDFVDLTVGSTHTAEALSGAPSHFQEAWMIYNEQHPFTPIPFIPDSAVEHQHQEYLALREAYAGNPVALQNLCKRRFGKTYWYYYDFVK